MTVAFTDVDGGTEVVLTHEHIPNADVYSRNMMGWASMLDKLGTLVDQPVAKAS